MLYIQQSFPTLASVCRYFYLNDFALLCSVLSWAFYFSVKKLLALFVNPCLFIFVFDLDPAGALPPWTRRTSIWTSTEMSFSPHKVTPAEEASSIPSYRCFVSAIHTLSTSLVTTVVDMVSLFGK
jgi:hypothetical protein